MNQSPARGEGEGKCFLSNLIVGRHSENMRTQGWLATYCIPLKGRTLTS